jgi:hypothetical protein
MNLQPHHKRAQQYRSDDDKETVDGAHGYLTHTEVEPTVTARLKPASVDFLQTQIRSVIGLPQAPPITEPAWNLLGETDYNGTVDLPYLSKYGFLIHEYVMNYGDVFWPTEKASEAVGLSWEIPTSGRSLRAHIQAAGLRDLWKRNGHPVQAVAWDPSFGGPFDYQAFATGPVRKQQFYRDLTKPLLKVAVIPDGNASYASVDKQLWYLDKVNRWATHPEAIWVCQSRNEVRDILRMANRHADSNAFDRDVPEETGQFDVTVDGPGEPTHRFVDGRRFAKHARQNAAPEPDPNDTDHYHYH